MEETKCKVLLIEDNEIEQQVFQRFVDSNTVPYDYVIAGSVAEARRALDSEDFDIIISDHDIGDGTALDVLNLAKGIPVIVVTGAGDEETAIRAWKAGAYDYLIKDIDQNYLRAIPITVENAIKHYKIEKELQLLSGAVMGTEDSVYIMDLKGIIIFVNKAFCKTYGYTEQEIIGKNNSILWIGRNQSENTRSVFQTRSCESGWEVGFYHRRKDGSLFPVSLSRSTIKDSNKKDVAIVGVVRDISERIFIEDGLRSESKRLKKANQFYNEMAILVSERLRKMLADGKMERASSIILDYLDILKINANKLKPEPKNFNFSALVTQIREAILPYSTQKNIEIKCSISDGDIIVNADYDMMSRVLYNFLAKAITLSPADSNIEVRIIDKIKMIKVEIKDHSTFIDSNDFQKKFNSIEWIKEQFKADREDLALGMLIAKTLVEKQGGQMWNESIKGGNLLCFSVPKACITANVVETAHSNIPVI